MEQKFTTLCFVLLAILLFSCIHLHQCRELFGYKFPVYSTLNCPRNEIEWNNRSSALNCTERNGYTCLPNENFTELLEFCYIQPLILIQEGLCLYLYKSVSLVNGYNCSRFRYGCPKASYLSTKIFEYPSCITIENGCFIAEPFCTSTTTFPSKTRVETHLNTTHIDYSSALIVVVLLLLGMVICAFILCMLFIYFRKKKFSICNVNTDEENPQDEELEQLIDINEAVFNQWKNDKFVPTKACDEVENEIKSHNLVIVSGHSGSGKSAIIQHIALKYRKEGWNVKPLSGVQELINIYSQGKRLKKPTLLILNDPFGKESFDERLYDLWGINKDALESCLETDKLLMSCRRNVLPENRIKKNELFRTSSIVKTDSDNYELTEDEKRKILHIYTCDSYLSDEEIKEIVQIKALPNFPSLCKSYASYGRNLQGGVTFFKEPIEIFLDELRYYRQNNKVKYCALVLLVFFNNHLRIDDLIENENSKTKVKHALELCGIQDIAPYEFGDILKSLEDFIVKKIDGIFQFHHDFLMDLTTFVFGTDYPKTAIKYGNVSFLRRKMRLNNSTEDNNQFIIYLSDKSDLQELGKRLFTDTFSENLLDVVLNPCLRNEEVYQVFIDEIERDPGKIYKLLERRKINTEEHKFDWTMKNPIMTNVTFVGLESEISPLFALIAFCHTELSEYCLRTLKNKQPCCLNSYLFSALCSNGSKILLNIFSKDDIKKYLKEKFGNLYPIHIVSVFHRSDLLRELVQLKIDVNLQTDDDNGWTPLILAASNDTEENKYSQENSTETRQEQTMQILVSNGANINLCAKNGFSPLFVACKNGSNSAVKFLLKKGADFNYQCAKNRITPLHIACHENHEDTAQLLLDHGANVNLCTQNGVSLLFNACQEGHDNVVQFLVKSGADINLCKDDAASPLYAACQNGHDSTVYLLLSKGAKTDLCKKNGESPIYTASEYGFTSIVELLLNNKANINLCKKNGESPLYIACKNGHKRIVQLLLEHVDLKYKGNINLCTKDGFSPLCIASLNGHTQTVQLLMSFGADIKLCTNFNESPLYAASVSGNYEIVEFLLKCGADVNFCNKEGESPLYVACECIHDRFKAVIDENGLDVDTLRVYQKDYESTVQTLINNGAKINLCKKNGESPLYIACAHGFESIVYHLLNHHANVNLSRVNRESPLFAACENGHENIVQLLLNYDILDNKADVNLCSEDGTSPLYAACQNGYENIVDLLLKKEADINLSKKNGESPLYIASAHGFKSTVQHLLNEQANANLIRENGESPIYIASAHGFDSIVELLLDKADVHLCKKNGESPLYIACKNGNERIVRLLLSNKSNINLCTKHGFSPLCIASLNGHTQTVQHLLNFGADIKLRTNFNESPLYAASLSGNNIIVQQLLKCGADINLCNELGESPLYVACQCIMKRYEEVIDENGLDVNTLRENRGGFCCAVYQKDYESTVQTLINNGAKINLCKKNGESPLYIACAHGFESIVYHLLNHHANVNLLRENGESPLFAACENGHENIVQLLLNYDILDNKADVNLCSEDGTSPLYAACQNGYENIVDLLLKKEADINLSKKNGESPLYIASAHGFDSIVELLLDKADVHLCKKNGESPLYIACKNGNERIVRLLLSNKSNINLCTKHGFSPLCIASLNGHTQTVQHLLNFGADIKLRTNFNESPVYAASLSGNNIIVQQLLKYGADINLCNELGESPLYVACQCFMKIYEEGIDENVPVNIFRENQNAFSDTAYQKDYDSTVQTLINNGADIDLCKKNGESPLYIACAHGFESIVYHLLNHHANVNLLRENGESPLYAACENGHECVVQLLLNCDISGNKADANLCREDGTSPLCIARQRGHDEIVKHLLSHGADQNLCAKVIESPT